MNWYPGHIEKTKRQIRDLLKLVNTVLEVRDARAPFATSAYGMDFSSKNTIIVLNKVDIADEKTTKEWVEYFREQGKRVITTFKDEPRKTFLKKLSFDRLARVLVVGVPNTGKSTIINKLKGKRASSVGAQPGITRGIQWFSLENGVKILDTPGILYKNIFSKDLAAKLLLVGSLPVEKIDDHEVFEKAFEIFKRHQEIEEDFTTFFENFAKRRGLLKKGGVPDLDRAIRVFFTELSQGKLGRVSFERPDEINPEEQGQTRTV
ncbi:MULTISPECIES: ribosome biogenesis GTPase YlqF [Thermotoga]|uniref:Ribosome biogenesis GTPase A n=1 Tax=Thermotoga neapolitana (strain ATCC 49049 / DSM 4359 / NBRC 107923 / NS-E) TaxID=309803 RepID=B9KAK2_THENN|nr:MULTISPECIES: ribosome biogenesis GTPase YlqF [Thermotoga]MDK2785422.1 ribosome biosis GTPase [Thermotoga sp.]HBF11764.1 ribosome biogenesis GTPase YlqF [Thermotoga neapolitana]ACM23985.1 Ras superfamily GTP-binding protein YlqF [Thermotoga neapolitana DSM 4359]AJG40011.1 ribosome biogenesis GTPase RsgA [Thermotoga sp. RQ7]KFZ20962.1 Ras superfamily GTP-binding protein YlqF [Thermotoga neapolitana LA10]